MAEQMVVVLQIKVFGKKSLWYNGVLFQHFCGGTEKTTEMPVRITAISTMI
jgi:hypothetical protein